MSSILHFTHATRQRRSPVAFTDTSENAEDTIALRFERQVAAFPDGLAVVTDETSLTYRALDLRANRTAALLASLPTQPDRPLVLLVKDEVARIAAMLGALKAGRIFISLAPDAPEKWVAQVIDDSRAAQIIVDCSTRSIGERVAGADLTVLDIEQLTHSAEPFAAGRTATPNDTAYIVYTSGSTGRPKGVAISHSGLIRRGAVRQKLFRFGPGDRCANLTSGNVSAGILYTLVPLLWGQCLFPFDLARHGLQKVAPWLTAQNITYVSFQGALLRTWLSSLPNDLRFPALRLVEAAGERLYARDVFRLSRHLEGDWHIVSNYSATECGSIANQVFTPSRLPDAGDDIVPVGRPVEGVDVYIEDETGALAPAGEIGEIVVRSRFLAQGYWNNPDLTAKVFQTDPLDSAIRIYRTGDLGRWRSDGTLEHMGRKGRRIRLRGYNIEPFEVECALMRQPGVTDAFVMLHDGAAGREPCLVGYVVAPPNASPSALRTALGESLPSHMVPSQIIVLDKFPVARTGKIDLNALPPPQWEKAPVAVFRGPRDERERELCTIWEEVLKIPNIGIDDDFFELGGTSLHALGLFAKLEARRGCSLSPTTIVQAPTIARLAELVGATTGVATSQSLVPLRLVGNGTPLFLVHSRVFFVAYYRHLVSELKPNRPIFALQPPAMDGKRPIPQTVEAMAASYIAEMRTVQPRGPYYIAGHSFGGRVSFEIAQQLTCQGEDVGFLGLIDTTFPSPSVEASRKMGEPARLGGRVRNLLRNPRYIWDKIFLRSYDLWIRLGLSIPYKHRPAYYNLLTTRANRNYVSRPYSGHITMFSGEGNSERHMARWGPLAGGGLTVFELPGGHHDMVLPPCSKLLAQHFDTCLETVEHGV